MCAILLRSQPNRRDPFINESGVLSRAKMPRVINSAWKDEVLDVTSSELQPGEQTGARVFRNLKLYRPTGLALSDCSSGAVSLIATGFRLAQEPLT